MANKDLSLKLKQLRLKNKLTQKDVYEQLGVSQSTFSSWEIGKSEPDAVTFLRLCDIYNVKDIMFEFLETASENITLNAKEKHLITDFRNLSEQGQEYILQTMDMVKDKYKKINSISRMEKLS